MGIKVSNKFSEHATITLGFDHKGREALSVDGGDVKRSAHIGATNAVGPKTVENKLGKFISELRDAVGGQLNAKDVYEIFERLTLGDGRGEPEGIEGVKLVGLTDDSFTVAIDNGRAVDTLTFEGVGDLIRGFDSGTDLGDGKSRLNVQDVEANEGGSGGAFRDLVGGQFKGADDAAGGPRRGAGGRRAPRSDRP